MFFDGIGIGFAKKIDIEKKYLIRFQKVLVLEKYWYRYWKSIGISIGKNNIKKVQYRKLMISKKVSDSVSKNFGFGFGFVQILGFVPHWYAYSSSLIGLPPPTNCRFCFEHTGTNSDNLQTHKYLYDMQICKKGYMQKSSEYSPIWQTFCLLLVLCPHLTATKYPFKANY